MKEDSTHELDILYRPTTLDEVVGQPEAVATIKSWGKQIPRALLLHGHTGTGKSTLAQIISRYLGITGFDYQEVNCGTVDSPIQFVRDLEQAVTQSPMCGADRRMWVLDEIQIWSSVKKSQNALLMVVESSPPTASFIFCTTDLAKVIRPLAGRCVKLGLKALSQDDLTQLITEIARKEKAELDSRVVAKIVEAAAGSARDAVKELQKVIRLPPAERLQAVGGSKIDKGVDDLLNELLPFKGSPSWPGVAKCLEAVENESAEGIRLRILGRARGMLLRGGSKAQAGYDIICCFDKPLFDNGGHALLAVGAWEVFGRLGGKIK